MDNTKIDEIRYHHELATSPYWNELKNEFLKFIVRASTGSLSSEKLQGMLMLMNLPETWINDFNKALKKKKDEE